MTTGRIHSFESFGTVDGPGIRFVVFMQGCPLRCIYCHNRDTWESTGGRECTSEQIANEMKKYMNYIHASGGGITVTGGEPTLQAEFVAEVFQRCRELGVHTALDTSGYADIDKVSRLLEYTDLVLLDIKHAVEEKHRVITGVGNEKIMEFARYTSKMDIPVWIRYVLVPGYTDDEEDLKLVADFIKSLKNVQKVDVLPFHSMGKFKWEKLQKEYILNDVEEPTAEQLKMAKQILETLV